MAASKKSATIPEFFWAQDGNYIYMKIGLVEPENVKTKITTDAFNFYCERNGRSYELKFDFRFPVIAEKSRYKITRFAEYILEKETHSAAWPHLLSKKQIKIFKNRCKVDWDRWIDDDEINEKNMGMGLDFEEFAKLNPDSKIEEEENNSDDGPLFDLDPIVEQYLNL